MRPFPGDMPPPPRRARGSSDNDDIRTAFQHPTGPQMTTYFFGDESAVDAALEQSLSSFTSGGRDHRKQHGAAGSSEPVPSSPSKHSTGHDRESSAASEISETDTHADDISLISEATSNRANMAARMNLSQPITPLMLATPGPASAISGVSSRRNSMTASLSDEIASQALTMSQELEPEQSVMMDSGSAPQLVMPSIKMPSRRPFTDEGKRIGRLKVLVAGDSGVGKTALIKAMVQSCEHIVHVDPIAPQSSFISQRLSSQRGRSKSSKNVNATSQTSEIFASTKPYPEWWSDLDDFRLLKRRKSMGDFVLDRNICFIDTPGYSDGASSMDVIAPVIRYVESHFEKVQSNASPDPEILNMLGGDGGNQVDVVFYLIQNSNKPSVILQSDTMTPEAIAQSKARIRSELLEAGVRPFSFNVSSARLAGDLEPTYPYAVSSTAGSDHDIMDASLLMSPDYVQPLVHSELVSLVEQVFCEDGSSWLRHAAAKKYLQWKSDNPSKPRDLYRPMDFPGGPSTSLVATGRLTSPLGATSQYSLSRIADHTQREERLAQIRLANWASDLQRSLTNERARYEALARGERAIWLTEKLNECVQDGSLVPVGHRDWDQDRSVSRLREKIERKLNRSRSQSTSTMQHQDPLGLLQVASKLKANSWVALEVVGGMGILGGVAIWVSKQGWHVTVVGWAVEQWSEFWNGDR
ncbi:Septin-7 [Cytospora mali]|uniref:Septin-7 n=1 Tax=Cytospora mali TaxID=578113 RepID=A0A194V4G6_CYTMA|nr:Septin-7 [Valsa mali var. pyri (nom. inval.)]